MESVQANRITQILNCKPDASPLAYFEYTYDAASRITQCQREDGKVIYYGYDSASRLTSEDWYDNAMTPIYAFAWNYDAVGNRTYQKRGDQETYYTYDAGNALIQKHEPGTGYSYYQYDSRGNCTLIQEPDGNVYFTYNHANLVTSIHHKTGVFNYFYYDSQLRRYAMQDSNGLAYFTWDSNGLNLLAEEDSEGNITAQYVHGYTPIQGIGSLVAAKKEVEGCTYYQYLIYDHRGTVVKMVDENAESVGEYTYDAWGMPLHEEESGAGNKFGWQSNWITLGDYNGGLLLSPTRIYSARDGKFLQRDPLGQRWEVLAEGSNINIFSERELIDTNIYSIVANNPVSRIDSFGEDWLSCLGSCIAQNDPMDLIVDAFLGRLALLIAGGGVPKSFMVWFAKNVMNDHRLARLISISGKMGGPLAWRPPVVIAKWLRMNRVKATKFARGSAIVLAIYGPVLAAIEIECAIYCCGKDEYDGKNIFNTRKAVEFWIDKIKF